MSIASEITALNTNLTAAKNAIVTKGGTVGNTGLAGLGNEILGIPAGGSTPVVPEPPSGAYVAFSAYTPEFVVDYVESADPSTTLVSFSRRNDPFNLASINDPDFALDAIFEDSPLYGEPYNLTLRWIDMDRMFQLIFKDSSDEEHVATEFFEWDIDSYGIQFSNNNFMHGGTDLDLAYIRMGLDFTSTVDNISITDPAEFATFMEPTTSSWESYESGSTIYNLMRVGGQLVQKQFITDINFGTLAQSLSTIDAGFFTGATMLKTMYNLPDSVTSIGASFLSGCQNFNSYFEIPSNATIGSGFLSGCTAFNQPITIPSGVTLSTAADYNFMYDCYSMTSTVTVNIPATAIGASNYIFSTSNSSAKCYTQGILIDGNYKAEWREKLPNRTSSPYRKFLPSAVIGPTNAKVYVGYTTQLSITFQPNTQDHSGTWSSSDTSIATVDQNGEVTGIAVGNVTITFQSVNGYSATTSLSSLTPFAIIEQSNGQTALVKDANDFNKLSRSSAFQSSWTETMNGVTISNSTITKVHIYSNSLTSIKNNFLPYCASLTQLDLPSSVSVVGDYFLYLCRTFDNTLSFPNLTRIGNNFMSKCEGFNHSLSFPKLTTIGGSFLDHCTAFNSAITFPLITTIGANFLAYCSSFNQSIDASSATSIGMYFLANCNEFNQPLDISGLTQIANYFLYNCYKFNQPIDLLNITTIGSYFLAGVAAFNQNLVLPSTITSIGTYFLYAVNNMVGTITCNVDSTVIADSIYTMSCEAVQPYPPMYTTGITLSGTYAQNWKTKFPDRTAPYRKLIVAS